MIGSSSFPTDGIEQYLTRVGFAEGERIFAEGDTADSFYLIDSGSVRIQSEREEIDTDPVLGFIDAGGILGEVGLLDGQPRAASAYAHETVKARRVSAEALEHLARDNPKLALIVFRDLGRGTALKLREANERLIHGAGLLASERDPEVDVLVANAARAQQAIASLPEQRIDALLEAIARAVAAEAPTLADATVRVTSIGNVADKTGKNIMASLGVYQRIAGRTGFGLFSTDEERKVARLAAPVGVVFGLVPVTNPVATAVFKALISIKSRNAVILSFHRSAGELAPLVGTIMQSVLEQQDAPADLVQWVENRNSRRKTLQFFEHPGVALILATGGRSMVKAAYSSGKPAIGVGPGNAPALICRDADLSHAASSIVLSKAFDNGLICGAEHNLIIPAGIFEDAVAELQAAGAAVLDEHEVGLFRANALQPDGAVLHHMAVGRSAAEIAGYCGIARPYPIKVLIAPTEDASAANALAREKMAPVLGLFRVGDEEEGLRLSRQLLEVEGQGHTAIIHARDQELIRRFATTMPVSRILANSPGAHGVVGWTTGLMPSLTLGCGTFGGTSTTANVTFTHLTNVKYLAEFAPQQYDFSSPPTSA